jgi:aspartate aminotransferase
MTLEVSRKVKTVKPSITLAITAKANEMKAKGIDLASFGAGEPDFDTPENIKQAGIAAIQTGKTKYTACGGLPDLKKAIQQKFKRDNNLSYELNQIIVSGGAKHSLYNVFQAILNPGDEVIVPAPYWVSYPDMVLLADGKPVIVQTAVENNFEITVADLEKNITPKTKAIVLNSPSNPTGCIYSRAKLEAIAKYLEDKEIYVISDDIYEYFLYDGQTFCNVAQLSEKMKAKTIVVNGVSKAYSMTGWRIGYLAGPAEIVKLIDVVQSQSLSNPTSISQVASIEALNGDQSAVRKMVAAFDERRKFIAAELNKIPGLTCKLPQGAFYVFPNISQLIGKSYKGQVIKDSVQFADLLLSEALVAVIPGSGFGAEGFVRLSYACSMDNIKKGLQRIKEFVGQVK